MAIVSLERPQGADGRKS